MGNCSPQSLKVKDLDLICHKVQKNVLLYKHFFSKTLYASALSVYPPEFMGELRPPLSIKEGGTVHQGHCNPMPIRIYKMVSTTGRDFYCQYPGGQSLGKPLIPTSSLLFRKQGRSSGSGTYKSHAIKKLSIHFQEQ